MRIPLLLALLFELSSPSRISIGTLGRFAEKLVQESRNRVPTVITIFFKIVSGKLAIFNILFN